MNNEIIMLLIIIAGIFGGCINYALVRSPENKLYEIFWSILIGLGASFLVPLFLNTISSTLLSGILDGTSKHVDYYVFFGFCLLGAISSRSMIQTLTQKILKTAEEAKREVEKLKEEIDPIVIKETEPDIEEHDMGEQANGGIRIEGFAVVGNEHQKIIKALGSSEYSRRTVQGIKKETKVKIEKVYELLSWLHMNGLAITTGEPNNYWSLTQKGRAIFKGMIH
ncbi:YEATS-associated helix-containing protein [Desulfomicrobium salsuginis]